MAPRMDSSSARRVLNKGAWTAEEDRELAEYVEMHGAKKWKTVAIESGLNRCRKSCRLRWLNYLRPNIKRGNISDEEEDLILRLHKLLGNRWSLIAARIPGRTDNEIKNYWNSHLSKKVNQKGRTTTAPPQEAMPKKTMNNADQVVLENTEITGGTDLNFYVNEFFDFSFEGTYGSDWVNKFLEQDRDRCISL